eukprot:TRINITY_DN7754_c0_g1_i5.p1 TRINITY_DN7754_c0_g1~~TRINITY_DN7754_c0_g1_i5.p1  ORF type:complete len:460 (+),score=63.66 TRINITY_DN7754_c0_g1_i5:65-1444(+)
MVCTSDSSKLINIISSLVELLGSSLGSRQLCMITQSVQQAWKMQEKPGTEVSGSTVRMHGSLMQLMSQLLRKIRGSDASNLELQQTMFSLLHYALNTQNKEYECLLEDALSLWLAGLCVQSSCDRTFQQMLPALVGILQAGKELVLGYMVTEAYFFLAPSDQLLPHIPNILECIHGTLTRIYEGLNGQSQQTYDMEEENIEQKLQSLDEDTCQEGLQACALVDILACTPEFMKQLQSVHVIMVEVFLLPLSQLMSFQKHLGLIEGMAETLGQILVRSPEYLLTLTNGEADKQQQLTDTWIQVASQRYMSEIIGLPMAQLLGRYKRRLATVVMCSMFCSEKFQWMAANEDRLVKMMSLLGQSLIEDQAFKDDQQEIDQSIMSEPDLQHDKVTMRRLELLRNRDAIRASNIFQTIQDFFQRLSLQINDHQKLITMITQTQHPDIVERLFGVIGYESLQIGL